MKHLKISISLLILLLLGASARADYALEKGKGVEVCEEYGKAINAERVVSGAGNSRPMPKSFTQFSKPQWKEASHDVFGSEYLPKVWRYWFDRDANPADYVYLREPGNWKGTTQQKARSWKSYVQDREEQGINSLYLSKFDIDNDGKPETLILNHMGHSLYAVLSSDLKGVDTVRTERTYAHLSHKDRGLGEFQEVDGGDWSARIMGKVFKKNGKIIKKVPSALGDAKYDFFIYKGKTYIDLSWGDHPSYNGLPPWKVGRLWVFISEHGKKSREVCNYKIAASH